MIVVFADDFSGAAEVGGVGVSYGLKVVLQKGESLLINSQIEFEFDLLVIDMDTRSYNESQALLKSQIISSLIREKYGRCVIFKKIDSVFRGHICAEIEAHLEVMGFDRIVLLPANPNAGRIIKKGEYYLGNEKLNETALANDPDFPRLSSRVSDLFDWKGHDPYYHLSRFDKLPLESCIVTCDLIDFGDILKRVEGTTKGDLVGGSGDAFRAFLSHLGYTVKKAKPKYLKSEVTILINGSTIKKEEEQLFISENKVPKYSIFNLIGKNGELKNEFFSDLKFEKSCAIYVDEEISNDPDYSDMLLNSFGEICESLILENQQDYHFLLTGGATAAAVIQSCSSGTFLVLGEEAPGVVTCVDIQNKKLKITTKPGSYPWGSTILRKLVGE